MFIPALARKYCACFLGRNAEASLKHLAVRDTPLQQAGFLGRNAEASLKRIKDRFLDQQAEGFLGRNAEASLKRVGGSLRVRVPSSVSSAEMPRPH